MSGIPAGTTAATDIATIDQMLELHSSFLPDAQKQLGGQPYDNRATVYHGSADDSGLNAAIGRFDADAAARAGMVAFQTTGVLSGPMVLLHTTDDPIVPVMQEDLYTAKVAQAQRAEHLRAVAIERYGHCEFTAGELQAGFQALLEAGR